MSSLALTLVADGTSDRALLPFISALMDRHCPVPFISQFADELPMGARSLGARVRAALDLYPCDLLFVHRDAEGQPVAMREAEIRQSLDGISPRPALVCVVPVRMTEAWLITSESAIRTAVGNPHGTVALNLPPVSRIESVDAKEILFGALEAAKDLNVRRRHRFRPEQFRHKVADVCDDLSHIRRLASFRHFESQVSDFFSRGTDRC